MIRLVVNAQEFGTTRDGDQGILRAHRDGIVTSTSVLGNCRDMATAAAALTDAPRLGVGVSLALVGGTAVAEREQVQTLLTPLGTLRATPTQFAIDWMKDAIAPRHVEHELDAQVVRALQAGLPIDHLCTRSHLGFLPGVGEIVERVARRHHIPGIRSSVEPPTLSWITDPGRGLQTGLLAGLSWLTRRRMGTLRHGPRSWGYVEAGRLDEVRIIEIIGRLAPGGHELICHPTDADSPPESLAEMRALTSIKVKTAVKRRDIVLCRWRDLF